jgi:hypothetical protein
VKIDANFSLPIGPLDDDVIIEYDKQETLQRFAQALFSRKYPYRGFSDLLRSQTSDKDHQRFLFCDGVPRVYQYSLDPPGFMISPRFDGIQSIARELNLEIAYPEDKYFSRLWRGGDFVGARGKAYGDYQEYTVETFGVRIDIVPQTYLYLDIRPLHPSSLARYWLTSKFELIQMRRIRVLLRPLESFDMKPGNPITAQLPHCPYVEERWNPKSWEHVSIGGLRRRELYFSTETERFRRDASRILARQTRKLGRPEGTTQYSPESFISTAKRIYCEELVKTGSPPTQKLVALKMGLSRSAFKYYWRSTRLHWPPHDWCTSN